MESSKRRDRWRLPIFGVAVIGIIVVVDYVTNSRVSRLDRFKSEVRSAIPPGSSLADVKAWANDFSGKQPEVRSWQANLLPNLPQLALPEVAGVSRADLKSYVEVMIPFGRYEVNGEIADNHLWVFLMLDDQQRVKSHHFLTLAELAEHEKRRTEAR
jgi:hypothetical protein